MLLMKLYHYYRVQNNRLACFFFHLQLYCKRKALENDETVRMLPSNALLFNLFRFKSKKYKKLTST